MHQIDDNAAKRTGNRGLWVSVIVFGIGINALMLTGPVFMVQVYERLLPARAVASLGLMFVLVTFLYAVMATLDAARLRILVRIAARQRAALERPALMHATRRRDGDVAGVLRDLDSVERFVSSQTVVAFLDAPWAVAFIALLFVLNPTLGFFSLLAAAILVGLAIWAQWRGALPALQAPMPPQVLHSARAQGMGIERNLLEDTLTRQSKAAVFQTSIRDRQTTIAALARAARLFFQSAMLALGAHLAIADVMSPGLIIAASIILGRALGPIESLASGSDAFLQVRQAYARLRAATKAAASGNFSAQAGDLLLSNLVVLSETGGAPLLRLGHVHVPKGQSLGVIGPSGSGKSVLAAVLNGLLPSAAGIARFGMQPIPLAKDTIGYLPQTPQLFDGTLAQNIARMAPEVDMTAVMHAAKLSGLQRAAASLPLGLNTPVQSPLPQGLRQRTALARALYGAPPLVVLDDPTAHLDGDGAAEVSAIIRDAKARGATAVVYAHRPSVVAECDWLLVLENGAQTLFGPREQILRRMMQEKVTRIGRAGGSG